MINEEKLLLYYYQDGLDPAEMESIRQALDSDRVLARRYERLKDDLEGMKQVPDVSAPRHLLHQWHHALDREAQLELQKAPIRKSPLTLLGWGSALAAMLTVGIGIGLFLDETPDTLVPGSGQPTASSHSVGAFQRGLKVHLSSSQDEIRRLADRPADERSRLLMQIVAQNRLFEQAAENNQAPDVARLMRAFEPILIQLASEDLPAEDADQLRRQLSFELQAMITKMQASPSEQGQSI
jgi:hypothetical protein